MNRTDSFGLLPRTLIYREVSTVINLNSTKKMIFIYALLGITAIILTIYFVVKCREFLKFLSGAFFVSGGVLFYLYLANVSVPILGTTFVQTPEMSGIRCIPHFIFSILCLYFGFIKRPKPG